MGWSRCAGESSRQNRSRQAIKILVYDGQGFWLHQKRLSSSKFIWWPQKGERATEELEVYELQLLLWNGDPRFARAAGQWRKIQAG
jgi:transposase